MKRYTRSFILLLSVCSIGACNHTEKETKAAVKKTADLKLMAIEPRHLSDTIQLPGVLEPFEFVQIFPKVNGFVKSVNVDRGTVVRKGAVLLSLEAPELEQHLSAAKLKYTEADALFVVSKDKYRRLLETSKTPGTISPYDLSTAQSKMMADSAMVQGELANYRAQQDMYSYLTVTAPFDGVITERNVHPGALVGPGSQEGNKPMLVLQQQSKLRMIVNIPEEYTMQIHDGGAVHFHLNALPGQEFTGVVARAAGSLNEHFRSEAIEIDIANRDQKFKAGMYAEVELPAGGSVNAFVVPKTAVVVTTERKYVVAVRDNKAVWVDVTVGNQRNDSTEIFGALKDGEHVVINANYDIKDGQGVGGQ